MRLTVDDEIARPTYPLATVVVERHRLPSFQDELLVENIEHFEE
jgi:hypothetical protein